MARILIVDDEPETRYALSRVLDSAGHEVLDASTAQDALDRIESTDVDAVLCDIHLPDDGGVTLVAEVARRYPGVAVVAIARSGLAASARQLDRAQRSGAVEVLHTPFDGDTLVARIARALQVRAGQRAAQPMVARPALG